MNKAKLILAVAASLLCVSGFAQSFRAAVLGVGGYNTTWESFGGLDIRASYEDARGIEAALNLEALTPGVNAVSLSGKQRYGLGPGQFYYSLDVLGRALKPYGTKETAGAVSIGYVLDHLSAQLGINTKIVKSQTDRFRDPVNLLYRGTLTLKKPDSPWNIYATLTDYTEYTYERMWQPIFILGGYADISEHIRLLGEATLQPAGVFHLDATFYGLTARAGLQYHF